MSEFTSTQLFVARTLARAFGHGWAKDPLGPDNEEILRLGAAGATKAWEARLSALDAADHARDLAEASGDAERIEWLAANPAWHHLHWRGLTPAATHRSQSGTVEWEVAPNGDLHLTVSTRGGGSKIWTLSILKGKVSATHHSPWPQGGDYPDWEKECAQRALSALDLSWAWAEPLPPPSREFPSPEPVRRL
jgi:hypothetical protein